MGKLFDASYRKVYEVEGVTALSGIPNTIDRNYIFIDDVDEVLYRQFYVNHDGQQLFYKEKYNARNR